MIIAVNISFLMPEQADDYSDYLQQLFAGLVQQHPEHSFVFIAGNDFKVSFTGSQARVVRAGPRSTLPLKWKWWTSVTLPGLLKKAGADLLIAAAGYGCPQLRIPQVLVMTGADYAYNPSCYSGRQAAFFEKNISRCAGTAARVLVFAESVKQDMHDRYQSATEKITVVRPAASAGFVPLMYAERQAVKEKYTSGTEYLLFNGALHTGKNLLHLLKAFSIFKKKQKTGMKLVFTGTPAASFSLLAGDLKTYRYRNDVIFTGPLTPAEKALVTASAYALVSPAAYDGLALPVLEALQSGVPVICTPGSAAQEIAGDAGWYASPDDYMAIAENMIRLYKNEKERASRIQLGLERAAGYPRGGDADSFREAILI